MLILETEEQSNTEKLMKKKEEDTTPYNVYCMGCDQVFQPEPQSPLWWVAKQRDIQGFLDAPCISGEKHGCFTRRTVIKPDAPFRVFGYDAFCDDFDIPLFTFVEAMKAFKEEKKDVLAMVFISGVSPAVQEAIS